MTATISLSTLNGTNGFRINGGVSDVSSAGDVNGDGIDDFLIGELGASYVVFGREDGFGAALDRSSLNGTNGFRINGETFGDFSGASVSSAGDVNGDGIDDLVIGASRASPNGPLSGASYVVFGKADGFGAELNLSSLNGSNGFQINGEFGFDFSGRSVSSAGDINGDGFDDILVGAYRSYVRGPNSGATYVVFGKADGFGAELNLSTLNGSNGFQINGETEANFSGSSVSSAGDINGDGFDDILVGAPKASNFGYHSGTTYVVFGKAGGFGANLELRFINGTNGFRIIGDSLMGYSGHSVSSAGDVNGDGFNDIVIGAPSAYTNGVVTGAAYVVFGKAGGFGTNVSVSALDGTNGFRISGEGERVRAGWAVSSAGDVNGDGIGDVLVGSPKMASGGSYAGATYVVFGNREGFSADLKLSALDGTNGFQIDGEAESRSATEVSAAGDVNGDGFDDILIAAYTASPGGASYVVYGRATSAMFRTGTAADETFGGSDFADILDGQGGNDRLFGNGDDDILLGGDGNDRIKGGSGQDIVQGGSGNDSLDGGAGEDLVQAGAGDDRMEGGADADDLRGGAGNDTLSGGLGLDALLGGLGDDLYLVDMAGEAVEFANQGTDTVRAALSYTLGDGIEVLTLLGSGNLSGTGNAQANTITGTDGANTLDGAVGLDLLLGGGGHDIYLVDQANEAQEGADQGTDTVRASASYALGEHLEHLVLLGTANLSGQGNGQANTLTGNSGANSLDGAGGNDVLFGNDGNDTLVGGAGEDFLFGGTGDDRIDLALGSGGGLALGSAGNDTLLGSEGADTLQGDEELQTEHGNDSLQGRGGDDWFLSLGGSDSIDGGGGLDILRFDRFLSSAALTFNVSGVSGTATVGGTVSTFSGIERFTVSGGGGNDSIATGNGVDEILGEGGNDILQGRGGDDGITGDGGNDILIGGAGADLLYGESGVDTTSYVGSWRGVSVDLRSGLALLGDAQGDMLFGIENVEGSAWTDWLSGTDGANRIDGAGGHDSLWGRAGEDWLLGGAGDDLLSGGTGADRLDGGTGNDRLTGDAGADRFVFGAGGGRDVVTSFENGADLVDLAGGLAFDQLTLTAVTGGVRVALTTSPGTWIDLMGVTLGAVTSEDFV